MCKKLIYPISYILLFGLFIGATEADINSSLVAYYPLDGDATDVSGNGNDGTFIGSPQSVPGKFGQALEFEGLDYVQVEGYIPISGADDRAVTAWIKMQASGVQGIVSWGVVSRQNKWVLRLDNGRLRCEIEGSYIRGDTLLNDGEWHHTGASFANDGTPQLGDVELYVDGVLEAHGDSSLEINTSTTGNLEIGRNLKSDGFFQGSIDDVRIYDQALTEDEIQTVMEGGSQGFPLAGGPNPPDGSMLDSTWVNLSWRPGDFAVSHDVYLGDNFDDVDNGTGDTFRGNQTSTMFVVGFPGFAYPDGLVPGTTYYWRIDEVNEADPNSPWKGPVWSFSIPPKTAYNPNPADGAEFVGPGNVTLTWTPGFGAILHTAYFGDDYDGVSNATGGAPLDSTTYNPGPLELEKVYYWRIDEFDAAETHKGDIWSFTTPGAVGNPQPAYDATDVQLNVILSWTPSDSGTSHELYFGTDIEAVRNADADSPEYKGSRALGAENYDPGLLDEDTTYSWRVDEVDAQGNTAKGPLWIFTTGSFLLIDDFESYTENDAEGEAIWQTWVDGYGVADNGAQVGNLMPPYCEQMIVHGGAQSMPLFYVNEAGVTNSEGVLPLTALRDWTQAGVGELSLWFRGASANAAEPMYVALSNTAGAPAIVVNDDAEAALARRWKEWRVPLQAFVDQGINLSNVDKFAVGLGTKAGVTAAGGSGTMFIDDIALYRSAP